MTPQCAASQASAVGMGRSQQQDRIRHRQQRMQIERTGKTVPDLRAAAPGLAGFDPFAELPRQDPAARDREAFAARRL